MADLAQQLHAAGAQSLAAGRYEQAAAALTQSLALRESSLLWNDWATAQWYLNREEEAFEGYRCALELEPTLLPAATNLALCLARARRWSEAQPWLELALARQPGPIGLAAAGAFLASDALSRELTGLLAEARRLAPRRWNADAAETYLRRFAGAETNQREYFDTHLHRYVATLEMVPAAEPGQTVLELGAAFHHLTPALRAVKGYAAPRCSDLWTGAASIERLVASDDGAESHRFLVDNFDVERAPWPYADAAFDLVLCCEILEHLVLDPMAMLSEINRVLKPGGRVLLTTPNLASAKAFEGVLRGESPYCWSQFEPDGLPTDRHNREYTTAEVERILACAGLDAETVRTKTFYWKRPTALRARLVAQGASIARRGDCSLILARKTGPVRDRFPAEFYQNSGTQSRRRQAEAAAETALAIA